MIQMECRAVKTQIKLSTRPSYRSSLICFFPGCQGSVYQELWDIIVIFQFQMLTERMTVEHSKKRHEEPEGWFKIENSCKLV